MSKKRRVLVCGASGFLGRNVFEALSLRGSIDVRGTYFTKLLEFGKTPKMNFANFLNEESCLEHTRGVDTVIQCAGLTAGSGRKCDWPFFASQNIKMNQNLIEAVVANKVKHFIFLSCSVMYPVNLGRPVKEEDVDEAKIHQSYFDGAQAKLITEILMKMHARLSDTHFTSIRHSNIYGPHDKFDLKNSHVMGATIQKTMTSEDGVLSMRGGINIVRDLLYVSDFVHFVEEMIYYFPERFAIFNVGAGKGVSIGELADTVAKISGRKLAIVFEGEKSAETSIVLDTLKARSFTGWHPRVSLEEGIAKTIEWWKKNAGHIFSERSEGGTENVEK